MTRQQAEIQAKEELGLVPSSEEVFGKRSAHFDKLVEERTQLKEVMKGFEVELKDLDRKIETYLADTETKTVTSNGAKITQCFNPGHSKLSEQLLVEAGVPATTIKACTVPGRPYTYVLVTPLKPSR